MIDLTKLHLYKNDHVDGELEDGRLVEFKTKIPSKFDDLIRQSVAMANSVGGFIIFGVNRRTLSVVGIKGDYEALINRFELSISLLSLGVSYDITHEIIDKKDVVILEIKKTPFTAYFSRIESTPARQIAYRYKGDAQNGFSIDKKEMRYTKVFKYMTLDVFLT